MKITTTGFGCGQTKNIEFDTIMFVHFTRTDNYEETKKIINQVSVTASNLQISQFFKDVANFMKSKAMRDSCWSDKEHYQFALSNQEHDFFPVKWFTLLLNNGDKIEHDIAFSTTYIKKNGSRLPFGRPIFKNHDKYPMYRELNMKRTAFKFVANQIRKND